MSNFDFGLAGFNFNNIHSQSAKDYLNAAMGNKMFDYFCSGLPVITFNATAMSNFVKINNCGFEKKDVAVGQVRFDRKNKIVKLSFSVCKSFRERGLGKKMVTMAIKKYKLNKKITFIGEVKLKNFPSIKIFKSLGFTIDFIDKIYRFKKICT